MEKQRYEIGGVCCEMTEKQAAKWNAGEITPSAMSRISCFVPEPQNQYRRITLRRAYREFPLDGCGANKTS